MPLAPELNYTFLLYGRLTDISIRSVPTTSTRNLVNVNHWKDLIHAVHACSAESHKAREEEDDNMHHETYESGECQGIIILPVQIRFLSLNVDRVDGVEAKPRGEREPVLVGPPRQRGQDHCLQQKIKQN